MKKQYVAPEIEIIKFEVNDIITHSLATSNGEGGAGFDWDISYSGDDIYINGSKVS